MKNKIIDRYIFIDTETGGVDPMKHSLFSIGMAVWDKANGILDYTEYFIKSDCYVFTKEAQRINGFNEKMHNERAVSGLKVIEKMQEFMSLYFEKDALIPLAGHNIQFDTNFLKQFLIKNGRSFNSMFSHRMIDTNSVLKTLIIADKLPPNIKNLSDALRYFNIKIKERHNALEDVKATVKLYEKMLSIIRG